MTALPSRQKVKRQAARHNQEEMRAGRSAWKGKAREVQVQLPLIRVPARARRS